MSTTAMTLDEFEDLVDGCGSDPARWPEPRRRAALALLASEPAARARLDAAMAFDRLLGEAVAVEAPAHLAARTSEALRRRREGGPSRFFDWRWLVAAGSAATAFGIGLGMWIGPATFIDPDMLMAAAFGGSVL